MLPSQGASEGVRDSGNGVRARTQSVGERSEGYLSRWTVVVGVLLAQVILGTVYGVSVFLKPRE